MAFGCDCAAKKENGWCPESGGVLGKWTPWLVGMDSMVVVILVNFAVVASIKLI